MTLEDLAKLFRPLRLAIANLAARAVVNTVDDSKNAQAMQVEILKDEVRELERLQNYGFTSSPKKGAEAVVLRVGGKSDHAIVIVCEDRRYRLSLDEGEVAVYDAKGSKIVLKSSGNIEITGNADVHVDGGNVILKGGSTPVAKEGSATTGHLHTLTGTAGPYPISGTAILTTDTVASGAGSANVKVP